MVVWRSRFKVVILLSFHFLFANSPTRIAVQRLALDGNWCEMAIQEKGPVLLDFKSISSIAILIIR